MHGLRRHGFAAEREWVCERLQLLRAALGIANRPPADADIAPSTADERPCPSALTARAPCQPCASVVADSSGHGATVVDKSKLALLSKRLKARTK